ncbi:dihydroneopterin aldolase [Hydrogenimonas sp.]
MTISIQNLEFEAIIGVLPKERISKQRIIVECEIGYAYSKSSDGENEGFIDYANVVDTIIATMQDKKFHLIEEALEALILQIKENFSQIKTIKITICKPDILPNCTVCVTDFRYFL